MPTAPTRVETALADLKPSLVVVLLILPVLCWILVVAMARDTYGPMTAHRRG